MQKMSDRMGYELLEVPDNSPDRASTQDFGRLRRDFGARRQHSVSFRKRSGEDENLSSREQDQTVGEKATLGSYLSPGSVATSCRLQYSSRKDGSTQKKDHGHRQRTFSSSGFHPHRYLCHQSEGLAKESCMETCSNVLKEDKNNRTLNIDELFQTALEEVKMNENNTLSGHSISTPMQNRRKMLVCNGGICPNGIATDEAMSSKSVKRLREASVEGRIMNDESADANSFISCESCGLDSEPNNISLPFVGQQEDRKKGNAIASGGMVEIDKNKCVQLLPRRKRMRVNSLCSGEVNRFSVCRECSSHWPCGSSSSGEVNRFSVCRDCSSHWPCGSSGSREVNRFSVCRDCSSHWPCGSSGSREVNRFSVCRDCSSHWSCGSSGSREVKRFSVCRDCSSHWPYGSSGLATQGKSQVYTNDVFHNSSREASARARQIEQDELLAKQVQKEFAPGVKGGPQNQRKMLVCNGGISPNRIAADEAMSNKSVKRLREASVEGPVMNDEGDENNFVQLPQRRKRTRVNSLSSGEVNRFSVCRDSSSPCSSSGLATKGKIEACRNDLYINSSRDDASEGNIKFTCKPQGCSRVHQNERQLARLDKTRGGLPSLSSVGDQGNTFEAGSPEVIFLGSRRPSRRNHSSTTRTSNVVQDSSCGVKVHDHTPIDVDSLEYPINGAVNLEESNKEASARARQIEQDELLARQLQEEFAREVCEGGVQQDDHISDLMVQRELREHVAASDSDSAPVSTGLHPSFGTRGMREPSHSLTIHPSLPPFLPGHSTVPLHRRRDEFSGRWHQASGRPVRGSRFQFLSHGNIEMNALFNFW
ncbi:uncharacterized protein LOC131042535 [Cryptomeria japonica]|uniref:uncharacterized protein LOC131042535 n=1 Tax=Cryptomeria japonica TaxID=3369 RepID=UPI0027D9D00E|nr:uncharacterized protein LOC131042535 [Cryptomeria japonica]XP_059070828.1 uncharacterized protein LOC131042535 [Cryptomeria japonica]